MKRKFNFKGARYSFPIGVNKDLCFVILTNDDGTWGNNLIIGVNDIPYATIPIVDKEGLHGLIKTLKQIENSEFKESND